MSEFNDRTQANLDTVLEETCRELPHHGGDYKTRKYIAEHKYIAEQLIAAARSGKSTLGDLRVVAGRALMMLTGREAS